MSNLIGNQPHQLPTNGDLGPLAYWSRAHFTAVVQALVAAGQSSEFAAGTVMLFHQAATPVGWTRSTMHDNKALRVIGGAAAPGAGGSVAFTTAMASRSLSGSVGNTTLSLSQIPSHAHDLDQGMSGANRKVYTETSMYLNYGTVTQSTRHWNDRLANSSGEIKAAAVGGSGAHNHSLSLNNLDMAVQYVDVYFAVKN